MKNKFITLCMLGIIVSQVFAPTVYNVNLIASELQSEILEEGANKSQEEVFDESQSSIADETSDIGSDENSEIETIDSEAVNSEIIQSESSSEDLDNFSITRAGESITLVETNPTEVYSGDSITNRVEISLNPTDTGTVLNDGEEWESFQITLDPEFVLNETFGIEITQSSTKILTGYTVISNPDGSTTIDFDVDKSAIAAGGQTIGIIFVTQIDQGMDLSDYGINVELCGNQGTCYEKGTTVLYHDPAEMSITKEMTNPKFAAAGEEITYEITMVANGTGEITIDPMPQIVDQLPTNVEYISSTPEGIYDGTTVTWDWTAEDIASRSKTVEVTIVPDEEFYSTDDTLTNTADAIYEGSEVAEDVNVQDIYPGFFINLPDGGIDKNAAPSTNPDGTTTAPGDSIFWHFDNIDYEGNATLVDYTLTDTFPTLEDGTDILSLDKICYGAVKESPNAFVDVTINYRDGSQVVLTAEYDTNGDNCISIPDEYDAEQTGVKGIVWNYGEVRLPFKIVGAGVETTINEGIPEGTSIENNLDADFNLPAGTGGEGEWDICPPPYISYLNEDGSTECRDEDGGKVELTSDEVYGIFTKDILGTDGNIEDLQYGDTVTYRLAIGNAAGSPDNLLVDGIYDVLPEGMEYVAGSSVISTDLPDSAEESYDTTSNTLSYSFLGDGTPLSVEPGAVYYIDYDVTITSQLVETLQNNSFLVSTTPDLILNGTGTTNTTEPVDFDGDGVLENVYNDSVDIVVNRATVTIDKKITNSSKVFVPANIEGVEDKSTINYQFTITNKDTKLFGTNYAPIKDPSITDEMPKQAVIDESSIAVDYSNAPSMSVGSESVTVTGSGISSPVDGEGQTLDIDFFGTLNSGESITVTYSANVKDYAMAAQVENIVSLDIPEDEKDFYTEDSVLSDDALGVIDEIAAQQITKQVSRTEAEPGQSVKYTVEVTNSGTMPLKNVTFIDYVPHNGMEGTTVNSILSQLPHVYYIRRGEAPVEQLVDFTVTYIDLDGVEDTATLSGEELEEYIVVNRVDNIIKLEATLPGVLFPGDMAQLVFSVETPTTGDNPAEAGDELHNTAYFKSTAVKMNGSNGKVLDNGSNEVITTIVDHLPGTYALGDFVYFDLDDDKVYDPDFDKPAAGAIINLINTDTGEQVGSTVVDSNGYYKFTGLEPGNYTVEKQSGYFDRWYKVYPQGSDVQSMSQDATLVDTNNLDLDFRIVPASIIGTVYYDGYDADTTDDSYYNSIYDYADGSENPLVEHDTDVVESEINLYDESDELIETATTVDGMFAFYNLKAGTYTVESTPSITASDGQEYLLTNESKTYTFTLERGEVRTGVDFGYIEPVEVEGTIWYDINFNDKFDSDENTNSEFDRNRNLKVELLNADNKVIESSTSDATDGTYNFDQLLPSNYSVKVKYTNEAPNPIHGIDGVMGIDDSVFTESADGLSSTLTDIVKASDPGTIYGDNNLGIYQNAYIEGNVYQDRNYDGIFDDTDHPATNVTVDLMDETKTTVIDTIMIDDNGNYKFTEVDPSQVYTLRMTAGNANDMFIDLNTPSSGQTDTAITVDANTSEAMYTNGTDELINLVPNSQLLAVDGSVYQYADIASLAFIDMDGDGQQNYDLVDTYYPGINVQLSGTDGMGYDFTRDLVTVDGSRVKFEDLNPGKSYQIQFSIPDGYEVTWKDRGDNATDSDINRTTYDKFVDLYSEDSKTTDTGIYQPVDLSGYVFTDTDRDGYLTAGEDEPAANYDLTIKYEDPIEPTETVVTTDSNGHFELIGVEPGNYSTVVTAPDGSYQFTIKGTNGDGVIASDANKDGTTSTKLLLSGDANHEDFDTGYNQKTSVSGKIYLDTNADLTWQSSELLIDGITVTLKDSSGNVVDTTVTDVNGEYQFADLDPADYSVEASTVNYASYENEDEIPSIQSDAKSPVFTAYSNTPVENVDGALTIAGDTTHYLISDYVWEDKNYNGIQDGSETPIVDATVTLLDADGNEVKYTDSYSGLGINSGDVATTMTDSNGNYLLIVEGAGDYQVKVEADSKYYLTAASVGDESVDNDFSATSDDTYIGYVDYAVTKDTRDIDAGLSDKGTISGYVYNDQDGDNTYDLGLEDYPIDRSQVGLFDETGTTLIETAITDINGYYEFTDLEAGKYQVKFENLRPKNSYWLHEADGTLYLDNGGTEAHRQITLSYGQDLDLQNAGQNDQSILRGIVYDDNIADGVYDADEDISLSDVTVKLMNEDGTQAKDELGNDQITTTNSSGQYLFINIVPGDYYVEFETPSGYVATNIVPSGADTNSDNDAYINGSTIQSSTISIEENQGYLTYSDAALYKPVLISGYYYDDYDIDGKFTSGLDQPINGSIVTLYNEADEAVMNVATDSDGYYEFTSVVPNNYYVGFDTSSYDVISIRGTDDTEYDNDLNEDGKTDPIRYESGNTYSVENDAAVYNLADISGYIYEDMNNDGYYQLADEPGIKTDVSLYNDEGFVETTSTNSDGSYTFADLTPDNYYVTVSSPGSEYYNAKLGKNESGIANELTDTLQFDTQVIYSGQDDTINFDGGFYQLTDIEGQVFFDSDTNLQLNGTEFGITDLDISLFNSDDLSTAVATTTTDANGNYQFNGIIPGDYVVTSSSTVFGDYEDMPEEYQIKSDMSTPVFTAYSNTLRDKVDGAVTQGTDVYLIGDYVWEDVDFNGLQDATEPAYSGMNVELIDNTGAVVDSYTTDTDGLYYFFAPKADYTLSFTAEDGYHFTKNAILNSDSDSNVPQTTENVSTVGISVDKNDLSYDAGVRKDGNINGRVYYDTDASGTWDETVDQSDQERTVTLYDGSTVVDSKTINLVQDGTEGTYNFTDLEPGDYSIEFSDENNRFWVQTSDGLLSFDNTSEGSATRSISLEYGQTINDQDAGYSTGASIAGFVYEDNDYDGTFSKYLATPTNDDIAIEGANVKLVDSSHNVLATTTTDVNGFYSFGNLEPYQEYAVEVENKDSNGDGVHDYTVSKLGASSTKYDNDMTSSAAIGTEAHTLGDNVYNDYDYDGGLLEFTNLSGYVYEDLEVNSTMDATDHGIDGITANLYDQADNLVSTTKTDGSGYYQFKNIHPGYYYVEFDLDGYEVSPLGTSGVALENDIDNSYRTATIDVRSRYDDDVNFDAAVYNLVSVGGSIFTDGNANGIFGQPAETGLANITVNLFNDDDEKVATTTSNADGSFEFTGLLPDVYYTTVDSGDYLISPLSSGTGITNDLKQDKSTASQYVPSSTTNYNDYDAGLYELTEISGKIYLDTNANLSREETEWLIPDVEVTLYDSSSAVVATTTTDSNGYYQFTDLTPGDYEVVAASTDYATYENEDEVPSIQSDASTGEFTALSATPVINVDGALTIAGDDHHFIISDYVWEDANYDGVQDSDEAPLADIRVSLLDASGNQLQYTRDYPGLGITAGDDITTTTDANGNYMLIAEEQADYIVETEATEDYFITGNDTTTDDLDNDFTGVTDTTNIGQYEYYAERDTMDVDSGYSEVGMIAGNVYDDEDYNFTYESGIDIDVSDHVVELYLATDLSTPIMTTTTDSSGYYEFKDLQANDYVVKFENLANLRGFYVPEADGSLILDDNGYRAHRNVTIGYGEDKIHENAGKSETLIFTGLTFEDMIADGVYDPEEDIVIPNVVVELLNADGSIAHDGLNEEITRQTNDVGQYLMAHFLPGDYKVNFITPSGYVETNVVPDDAQTTKNNDAILNESVYQTDIFSLEEHALYQTYGDASYYKPVTIEGDYYEDKNTDGNYDDGLDALLSGYDVELVSEDGTVVDTVQTDSNGHYIFNDVVPGYYQVKFDTSSFDGISKLGVDDTALENDLTQDGLTAVGRYTSGNTYTTENDGAVYNYAKLSGYAYEDRNNDGYMDENEIGLRTKVTLYSQDGKNKSVYSNHNGYYEFTDLEPGKYYVVMTPPDASYHPAIQGDNATGLGSEINASYTTGKQSLYSSDENTTDFDGGMYRLGSISGQLFWDSNEDLSPDGSDFGIWDVEVSLYRAEDLVTKADPVPFATTITDENGNYRFDDLVPGQYAVQMDSTYFGDYEDMPANFQVKDTGHTELFAVDSGDERTSVDGAITRGIGINYIGDYVWEDVDNDGKQDPTEAGYEGATVNLIAEDGTVVDTSTTDAKGYFDFFAPAANYQVEVTVSDDYHFTNNDNKDLETNSDTLATTDNSSCTELFDASTNRRDIDSGVRLDGNISGRVYYDTDASGTYNNGDSSTEVRTVSLYKTGSIMRGEQLIETQEIDVDNDGMFAFTDLTEGAYRLEFSDDVNRFWVENADGNLIFDNNTEDVASRELVLNYGATVSDQDAGYAYGAAISGYIYNDDNYNGMYDSETELPESNATVQLIGNDGVEIAKTTTDSEGHYGFTNLEPGLSYSIVLDNKDSDGDGNDDFTVTKTQKLNKKFGNDMVDNNDVIETAAVTLNDNEVNDIDFDGGITYKTSLSGYVYEDKNIDSTYNESDVMLNDIEVTLYDENATEVAKTTTKDGYFEFANIEAGYYKVGYDLVDYNVSPKGLESSQYANDMNSKYYSNTNNVEPKIENNVDFDAAVYTDEDKLALDEDKSALDDYDQMNLGKTGQAIIGGIIAAIIALVVLVFVKKKFND